MTKYPKKLIEVAMPLDDINKEAAREKSIRHGHPSTLHLWWARRPLAAARAVLFAQLINDPGGERGWGAYPGQTKEDATRERERLFDIIRDLVKWENTNNEEVLKRARVEIRKSWAETCKITGEDPDKMPPFLDPFSGGGTIPLEAQRLGLESHGSDLNPVAVMIGKALIEIPSKFPGRAPVGPVPIEEKNQSLPNKTWKGAEGLAEDVRRYGSWMREEAFKRIGNLYPQVQVVQEKGGSYRHATPEDLENPKIKVEKLTVIACLWARTVASPNPAYRNTHVPLVRSFWISTKKGKETWVKPEINEDGKNYHFEVMTKGSPSLEGTVNRNGGICILSGTPMPFTYIRSEGLAGRLDIRLMAIVAEGKKGRIYLSPISYIEEIAKKAEFTWKPDGLLPVKHRNFQTPAYGMPNLGDLFTNRQLAALTTFSELIFEAREKVISDAKVVGWEEDGKGLNYHGISATAYADAIATYLSLAVSRSANTICSLAVWSQSREQSVNVFSRQALPMNWDFPEVNPFAGAAGDFALTTSSMAKTINKLPCNYSGEVEQRNALELNLPDKVIFSTDPPYYDNIGYADLSDFFYTWLRPSLKQIYPDIFSTLLVPKVEELIASPIRHGGKEASEKFFLNGMTEVMKNMSSLSHPAFPVTIYYAFKQSESDSEGVSSTGWETFLDAVLRAGFAINGTLPLRTERPTGVKVNFNALASSIILVCRKRDADAPTILRRQFLRELDETMPEALSIMVGGKGNISPIAPVDLAQAAIGPGIGVFSQYAAVLEMDGTPMTVRTALTLINKAIDEYFTQAEGDMDAKTRFCVDWFQTYGFRPGAFGEADVLARAKGSAVETIAASGVLESGSGKVRLYKVSEYPADWNPETDSNTSIWEACHQLSRSLKTSETSAGALLSRMSDKAEPIRQLAYRLYTLCERKGWAEDAGNYNELITSWHPIVEASQQTGVKETQRDLFSE